MGPDLIPPFKGTDFKFVDLPGVQVAEAVLWKLKPEKTSRQPVANPFSPGQRPKNQTHLLQGQGLQKAHTA